MEFTDKRAAILLELFTMLRAYRILQDLVDAGGVSRSFTECCENAGFAIVDFRKTNQITAEEEKQFSKAMKRGMHAIN